MAPKIARMRPLVHAVLWFVVVAGMPAQDRRPLLGTVVDADGKAVAGATVNLTFVPRGHEDLPPLDQASAVTDARGRFRVDVLPCAQYRCWALGPPREGGGRLASFVVPAAAGHAVDLQVTSACQDTTLVVTGLDAWPDLAPFAVRAVYVGQHFDVPLLAGADGHRAALPVMAGNAVMIEVLDGKGQVMHVAQVSTSKPEARLVVPAPQTVPMRVVDDQGAPVAGARLEQRFRSGYAAGGLLPGPPVRETTRVLGTTDVQGRLQARVPLREDPFQSSSYKQLAFLASAPGRSATLSGFTQNPYFDGKEQKREGVTELRFTLGPATPLRARLVAGDQPLAGVGVVVHAKIKVDGLEGRGWQEESWRWRAVTDAEGRFVIENMAAKGYSATLLVAAGATAGGVLPPEQLRSSPPQPWLLHGIGEPTGAEVVIDLRQLRTLQLRILDEGKGPARGAQVLFVGPQDTECGPLTPQAVPDAAGRLCVRAQPGTWVVFVRNETSMALQKVDLAQDADVVLQLEPMPAMRGRVLDAAGKPVAGAQLQGESAHFQHMGNDEQGLRTLANAMNWSWIAMTKSDADGRFACRFLSLPGMSYQGRFRLDGKQSERFTLDVDAELDVTVR